MNICILMGSPNQQGNTATLVKPFALQLEELGATVNYLWLGKKRLNPCQGCYACQNVGHEPGCVIEDDMNEIYQAALQADCIVYATPIYSWFCTAPLKAVMDRFFCMNKFYGNTNNNHTLWKDKMNAIIATCGYQAEYGADLFEEAIKRGIKHSNELSYIGKLVVQDINGIEDFKTDAARNRAMEFAIDVCEATQKEG